MRSVLVVSLLLVACSTPTRPIAADEARIAAPTASASSPAPAASSAGASSSPAAPPSASSAPQQATSPRPAQAAADPKLGAPCEAGAESCGKSGRVAFVLETNRHVHAEPPCKLAAIAQGTQLVRACTTGDRLYVSSVCIVCRQDTETTAYGVVEEMTSKQLETAQQMTSLSPSTPLTTVAAWSAAIKTAAGKLKGNATVPGRNLGVP